MISLFTWGKLLFRPQSSSLCDLGARLETAAAGNGGTRVAVALKVSGFQTPMSSPKSWTSRARITFEKPPFLCLGTAFPGDGALPGVALLGTPPPRTGRRHRSQGAGSAANADAGRGDEPSPPRVLEIDVVYWACYRGRRCKLGICVCVCAASMF
jgi:hypothetical protein